MGLQLPNIIQIVVLWPAAICLGISVENSIATEALYRCVIARCVIVQGPKYYGLRIRPSCSDCSILGPKSLFVFIRRLSRFVLKPSKGGWLPGGLFP